MNKTVIITIIAATVIGIGGDFIYDKSKSAQNSSTPEQSESTSPSRSAEINGYILSSLGNEIKIAKEVGKVALTEEEQAAKKAETQKLSPEERAAAREAENTNLETEDVALIIPVGIPIIKGSGDASGNVVAADIADLAKGVYVSIWTDAAGKVEYVKIKGS